jgi:hypothetical protein
MDKLVTSSRNFYVPLKCNDVLRPMVAYRFTTRTSLIVYFHSERNISVNDEFV